MADDRSNFLNESGKVGLVLAGVAIAYMLISNLLTRRGDSIHDLLDNLASRTTRYLYSVDRPTHTITYMSDNLKHAFPNAHEGDISPGTFSKALDTAVQAYSGMLTSDQIDNIMNMESSLPTIGFFANLIWCWLIGTIISAIVSSNICNKSNPFDE